MPLALRIFLLYFLFVGAAAYFVFAMVMGEIKPGVRQSTEETLVDTANLLAEMLRDDLINNTLEQSRFPQQLKAYGQREIAANIWGVNKKRVNHRIYVTDANGIVLLDSSGLAVGQDYSQWRDVQLTLRGRYGARSTKELNGEDDSTVMYVAAPIKNGDKIIGVVTVAKPNRTLQPYIDRSQRRLTLLGIGFIALGLFTGASVAWWLGREIARLKHYAQKVSEGERINIPRSTVRELAALANAMETMRIQLEGKAYVERYVQTLTHEIKSPLAAIAGAAELLQTPMNAAQHQQFANNIAQQCVRLQQLIERLLNLALIEQRQHLESPVEFDIEPFIRSYLLSHQARLNNLNIIIDNHINTSSTLWGEPFLLQQAVANLVENAIEFTPALGVIELNIHSTETTTILSVHNQGPAIPDYALPRIRERFYSLPRPLSQRKSTGLGLNFIEEVMQLHKGELFIENTATGVLAQLHIPKKSH